MAKISVKDTDLKKVKNKNKLLQKNEKGIETTNH
jgi:hypothetical protein